MRKRRRVEEEQVAQPPMTPMIDVIFQLLIYFMLTMHFKEIEGKLISQLPKREGPTPSHSDVPTEVRILLCAGGDIDVHRNDKGRHERTPKPNDECFAWVERHELGILHKTEAFPDRAPRNKAIYRAIGVKAAEVHAITPPPPPPARVMIVLDADGEVPYEHIIGVVNACKEQGLQHVEFVGNSRFEKYYGPK